MDREERHKIFREELYPKASLPREDFLLALEEFRLNHPDLLPETEPIIPTTTMRSFLKNFYR